jgi:hypothetical protein
VNEQLASSLNVYPNPVENTLRIDNAISNDAYSIYNAAGGLVEQGILNRDNLRVETLPAGIYTLRLSHENSVRQARFIKK